MAENDMFGRNVCQFLLSKQLSAPCSHGKSPFCLALEPCIDLPRYVFRIRKYLSVNGEDGETPVLGGLVLFERFLNGNVNRICRKSTHSIFFTCVVLAYKFVFDDQASLGYLAQVGGISIPQLLDMEQAMFAALGFDAGFDFAATQKIRERISIELLAFDQDF